MTAAQPDPEIIFEADILARARRWDLDALGVLHERYYPEVYRYVFYRLGDEQVSEGVCAEVFVCLLSALPRRRGPARNLRGWLLKTAAGLVDVRLRDRTSLRDQYKRLVASRTESQPLEGESEAAVSQTRQMLRRLSLDQQHLLAVRFAQNRSLDETAAILEKPARKVKAAQFEALAASAAGRAALRSAAQVRALENCLQQVHSGSSLEATLELYPQWAAELRPLLEAAARARLAGERITLPEGAAQRSWEIVSQAARGVWSRPRQMPPAAPPRQVSLLPVALVLLGVLVALLVGWAFQVALPGSRLYPARLAVERGRQLLAGGPAQRLELELQFQANRVEDVRRVLQRSLSVSVDFTGPLLPGADGEWRVGEFILQVPEDTQVVGAVRPGYLVSVQAVTRPEGKLVAQRIQPYSFEFSGKVQTVLPERWTVAGLAVALPPGVQVQGEPNVGSQVTVFAHLRPDGSLEARLIKELK